MRLIDADTLKEHKFVSIDCYLKSNCDNGFPQYKQGWNDAIDAIIDNAPTADDWQKYSDELWKNAYERGKQDARPQGEWNEIQAGMFVCPFCGARPHKDLKNFCAKCGADMRGGRE